ncbi:TetR/AcrR family transcriptional regulator [Maribellus maritimus]|uniref:TetR/AcrR family transcriptional regulator n=1 Tax=Maribellus maritimus TaxID=2870838 RepID=UPI001EEBA356|nr:TetR/AcrR family transcriptional regulator [Maribellus maritimus]MCG6189289.1 TetR/AcrR family transcriptional regulator [Maribellus maritimus]
MSPRSAKQFDDIRKQKKELIMETALELFAEKGFHATSISQIAKKAGISKGLTYNYFESKKEILDELIQHGFNTIFDSLDLNKDGIVNKEEFIHFIKYSFSLVRKNLQHWRLFFSLLVQPHVAETFSKEYKIKGEPVFLMMYNFIKSQGSDDPEGDLMAISAMIEGAFLYFVAAPDVFPMDIMEEKVIDACFKIINN